MPEIKSSSLSIRPAFSFLCSVSRYGKGVCARDGDCESPGHYVASPAGEMAQQLRVPTVLIYRGPESGSQHPRLGMGWE